MSECGYYLRILLEEGGLEASSLAYHGRVRREMRFGMGIRGREEAAPLGRATFGG